MGFLIDSCVWIDVERGVLAPGDVAAFTQDEPVFLSPVTIAELKFGAEVAAEIRRAGRHHRYRVQDIWLASQAIQHGYRLPTRNRGDFEDIPGLDLLVIG